MSHLLLILALTVFQPTNRVAFVGDSITASHYPEIAAKMLHTKLYRYAVPGADMKRISRLLDKALKRKPSYVVLYAGINDCAREGSDYRIVFHRLDTLVRRIEAAGSIPIVVRHHGYFRVAPRTWHGYSCSYMVNSMMTDPDQPEAWPKRVRTVDTRPLSDQEDSLLREYDAGDGLHLNYRGQKRLATLVAEEIVVPNVGEEAP